MGRVSPFLVLALLVTPALLAFGPAAATSPLVADAGDSAAAYNGAPLAVSARAFGGVEPYAFSWSWNADASRFSDAGAAATTFDTSGLAPQDVVLTVTVTDANGAVASDVVRGRVDARTQETQTFLILGGAANVIQEVATFTVGPGVDRIDATLDWAEPIGGAYDIDFELLDPNGASATGNAGFTTSKPERVSVANPAAGNWTAAIYSFVGAPTEVTLTIESPAPNPVPLIILNPRAYGTTQAQALSAWTSGGVEPVAFTWDLDGDGYHETAGASPVAALPVGVHTIGVRVTDAVGFESSTTGTLDVRDVDAVLHTSCLGDAYWDVEAMELSSTKGTCWIHGGHHTYFFGDDRYALRGVSGFLFAVEQQLSPPTEYESNPTRTPMHLQVSEDGLSWTDIPPAEYRFAPDVLGGELGAPEERQRIDFTSEGAGQPFRFLRVHSPLSAAQGLSGYLDNSQMLVDADILGPADAGPASVGRFALSCDADIMEDFFATHPCWYGGIDRWDAASFWHTYPVGDGGVLDAVAGNATLLPFRTDDWNDGNTTQNATRIGYVVQISVDGAAWKDLARVEGEFGSPIAFDVPTPNTPARFVRLFPDYHAGYDDMAATPSYHHPRGYFVDSAIEVEGHVRG